MDGFEATCFWFIAPSLGPSGELSMKVFIAKSDWWDSWKFFKGFVLFLQKCVKARALYDNIAEAPDELAFRKGDVLTVLEQNTAGLEGWWLCALRGRQVTRFSAVDWELCKRRLDSSTVLGIVWKSCSNFGIMRSYITKRFLFLGRERAWE